MLTTTPANVENSLQPVAIYYLFIYIFIAKNFLYTIYNELKIN